MSLCKRKYYEWNGVRRLLHTHTHTHIYILPRARADYVNYDVISDWLLDLLALRDYNLDRSQSLEQLGTGSFMKPPFELSQLTTYTHWNCLTN
jgi:hypothetical protein